MLRKLQWCLFLSLQHRLQSPFLNPNITPYLNTQMATEKGQPLTGCMLHFRPENRESHFTSAHVCAHSWGH